MTVWYKQGAIGDLQPIARKGLGKLSTLFASHGLDLFITSLRDSNHMSGSLHYDGLAFDVKYNRQISNLVSLKMIKDTLGPDWDVVQEPDHVHCEHDPE